MLRVVLFAEDTTLTRRIAGRIEENPSWELLALCPTLADLNFVLDRMTVDVLLLQLTPETSERVLSNSPGHKRTDATGAPPLAWSQISWWAGGDSNARPLPGEAPGPLPGRSCANW